jgi:hypothetical protein
VIHAGHDSIIAQRWPQILKRYQERFGNRAGQWAALQAAGPRNDLVLDGEDKGKGKGRDKQKEKEVEDKNKGLPPPPTMTDIVLEVAHRLGYNNPIDSPEWSRQPIFLQSFGERLWTTQVPQEATCIADTKALLWQAYGSCCRLSSI